jgi:octaprenyl-diphosphate synthase
MWRKWCTCVDSGDKDIMNIVENNSGCDFNTMDLLLADYLQQVDKIIREYSASDVLVVQDVVEHLLKSGGKRLRLRLVVLVACACGLDSLSAMTKTEVCEAAAVLEFIHSATLLHDDVVDDAETRRHHQAARMKWGNEASVLVGDFMYSRAFQLLATRNNTLLMHLLAYATARLSEGEVDQLTKLYEHNTSEQDYYNIIKAKTGVLFAASCKAGAMLTCPGDVKLQTAMYDYGLHLGMAFQIMDDILDYSSNTEILGKLVGKDLMEGKMTLPLIYALQNANSHEQKFLHQVICTPDLKHLPEVLIIFAKYDSLDRAYGKAQDYIIAAKAMLQDLVATEYKAMLIWLADFALVRSN